MSDKKNIFHCDCDQSDTVEVSSVDRLVWVDTEGGRRTTSIGLTADDALEMAKVLVKLAFEVKHKQGQEIPVQPLSSKRITVPDVFWGDYSMTISFDKSKGLMFFDVSDEAIALDKFQASNIAHWMLRQTGEETVSD